MRDFRFDHIQLTSQDPVETARFYEDMFGARQVAVREVGEGRTVVGLVLNGLQISVGHPRAQSLVPGVSGASYGIDHVGFAVDDLEAAVNELKEKGMKFVMDVTQRPGVKISFLLGPENVLLELLERD